MLTLNADALDKAINDFQSSAHYDETKRARYKNLNNMIDLKKSLNNTLCPNSIPVCYAESSSGRLSPSYGTSFPSVITMSKELKSLIFSGQGLVDVDISNAHLSIFSGLSKKYKIECPNIEYYLENKDELRQM